MIPYQEIIKYTGIEPIKTPNADEGPRPRIRVVFYTEKSNKKVKDMSEEIENCPCCNNAAEIIINKEDEFRIKCPRCGLMTESCDKDAEDVVQSIKRDWNRREYNDKEINDLNQRIENLEKDNEELKEKSEYLYAQLIATKGNLHL